MQQVVLNELKYINTQDGEVPFLKDCWSFFSVKGVKTSFISINPLNTFEVDLQICESLGCPIHILTNSAIVEDKWATILKTLKTRKIDDADKDKEWLKGLEKKWILPKNIVIKNTSFNWNTLQEKVSEVPQNRIDIFKIESTSGEERMFLYSLIESGYRPGIILVKYTNDPDANVPSMLVAGHLQNTGYRLLNAKESWFIYIYTDLCVYEACSWRNNTVNNPLVKYFGDEFTASAKLLTCNPTPEVAPPENEKKD